MTAPVSVQRAEPESAVLLDSPHSGSHYPPGFGHTCSRALLRATEDMHVERLFGFAPSVGATLVQAHFPRSFIDANRSCDDIDPLLLEAQEAHPPTVSAKSQLGMGLVWRLVDGQPIYGEPLRREEIQVRIQDYWRPYQQAVLGAWRRITDNHGFGIHLNCHSMPSTSRHYPPSFGGAMPFDIIIGTRDGATASPGLTRHVADTLRGQGYNVGVNQVFKGVELVRLTGDPRNNRHALQIEVNKRLYMDERTLQPTEGFLAVRQHMRELVASLTALNRSNLAAMG